MLKLIYATISLLLCNPVWTIAQESSVAFFYEASLITDTTNRAKQGTDLMVLFVGQQYSVYQSYYGFRRDSVVAQRTHSAMPANESNIAGVLGDVFSMPKATYKHILHKDFKESSIQVYDNMFFDNYIYEQNLSMKEWELKDEYRELLGFRCQKAVTRYAGRVYIAWFTEEIPISDGPYVFNGLPGLIVEISDEESYFNFSLVGIQNRVMNLEELTLKKPIKLSRENFFTLKAELYRDVRKGLAGKPAGAISDEAIERLQTRYDKVNNFLEKSME